MKRTRTRADALDRALDRMVEGRPVEPPDAELAALLAAAGRARAALARRVPEETAAAHIAAAAEADDAVPIGARSWMGRRRARAMTIGIAVATLLILSSTAAVAASASALPGEALYPVKRAVERMKVALPGNAEQKASLHLDLADERLSELQELFARRDAGESVDVGAAMSAYVSELGRAEHDLDIAAAQGRSDDEFLAHVLGKIDKHVQRLSFLLEHKVPEQAQDAIRRAIENAEKAKGKVGHGRLGEGPGRGRPDGVPSGRENAPGQQKRDA